MVYLCTHIVAKAPELHRGTMLKPGFAPGFFRVRQSEKCNKKRPKSC